MNIETDKDLTALNTFGLPSQAAFFCTLDNAQALPDLTAQAPFDRNVLWLGGGSNILLPPVCPRPVVRMANRGIRILSRQNGRARVEVQAGETWHGFVRHTLAEGLSGLENLSLIPGTAGAAPVQNIGAYGVEVKERIESVRCFDLAERRFTMLSNAQCRFGYRDSLFKQAGRGRYVIVSVVFVLDETFTPRLGYGDLASEVAKSCGSRPPRAQDVADAVCRIRRSRLPDPAVHGNVGSFFKNPVVSAETAAALLARYPAMPHYPQPDGRTKLAAGWLIDQCALKGCQSGGAAVHDKQALVLLNRGGATLDDVRTLAELVRAEVAARFAVDLESEPEWIV